MSDMAVRVGCGPMHALSGVRVLDFTRVLAGPHCTMVLADLGADVIKVERPGTGDDTRQWGPPFLAGDAAYYLALNRNKRSVVLDFENSADRDLVRRLAAGADVIVENFRPGVLDRFGLGWDDLRADRLVYCSIPAFGPGPRADEPGYDIVVQALTGFMSITGDPSGEPAKIGVALLDLVTGLYAAIAVLAALETRRHTGESQRVTVPLFDAAVAALANQAANHLIGGIVPRPMGSAHPNLVPYQAFAAADGFVVLAGATDAQFRRLCDVLGLESLGSDPRLATNAGRVAHREVVVAAIARVVATRTVDAWVEACRAAEVPAAPVRDLAALFAAPETTGLIEEITDPVRGLLRLVRSPMSGVGTAASLPAAAPRRAHCRGARPPLGSVTSGGALSAGRRLGGVVLVHEGSGAVGVAGCDGFDERSVMGGRVGAIPRGERTGGEHAPQNPHLNLEQRRSGDLDDLEVQLPVQFPSLCAHGGGIGLVEAVQLDDVGGRGVLHRQFDPDVVERGPNPHGVGVGGVDRLGHVRPAMRMVDDDAGHFEPAKGLPHRGRADVEALGDGALLEGIAGAELALLEHAEDLALDEIDLRKARFRHLVPRVVRRGDRPRPPVRHDAALPSPGIALPTFGCLRPNAPRKLYRSGRRGNGSGPIYHPGPSGAIRGAGCTPGNPGDRRRSWPAST